LKKIEIVAEPVVADAIKQAFARAKVGTILLIGSYAAGPGISHSAAYRGIRFAADVERTTLCVVVSDHRVDETVQAVCDAVQDFPGGEIEVTISEVEDVIHIRSTPTGVHLH